MTIKDKVAIITGASSGIGYATALVLSKAGAKVAMGARRTDKLEQLENKIKKNGGDVLSQKLDVTKKADCDAIVEQTIKKFGTVDILVNNAGWDVFRPFLKTDPNLWEKIIDINLRGTINTHYAVLKGMAERGKGRIVNIASDAARVGSSGEAVYAACKAGIIGLSKTLAREHARQGITFNVVCPGPTETGLLESFLKQADKPEKLSEAFRRAIPMGRLGQPSDLPGIIVFLASDDAAFITGQVISVSGGLTMNG